MPLGDGSSAARRHRGIRRRRLGDRRRPECDRPGRRGHPRRRPVPAAPGPGERQPQHRHVRRRRPCCGSPARPASTAGSTRPPARCGSSMPRRGAGRTASRPRRRARSTTPPWPAATSPGSTPRPARRRCCEPPTPGQGARRVWSDSLGRIWVSEWNAGQVGRYDPAGGGWTEWPLPGDGAQAYSVYVDDRDQVWLTDFTANAHRPLRPGHGVVHHRRAARHRGRGPADARPARRGVGGSVGPRPVGGRAHGLTATVHPVQYSLPYSWFVSVERQA